METVIVQEVDEGATDNKECVKNFVKYNVRINSLMMIGEICHWRMVPIERNIGE